MMGSLESTVEVRVDDGSLFANIVMLHNSVERTLFVINAKVTFMESQL